MQEPFQIIRDPSSQELLPFEEVVAAYIDSLLAYALWLNHGQREAAEDLLQEVFLHAFRNYASVRSPEKIKAWLFKIMKNLYINETKRLSHRLNISYGDFNSTLLDTKEVGMVATPEEDWLNQRLSKEVEQALNSLPAGVREIVLLFDLEGFSYKEISEVTGHPLGTVSSKLHRAHRDMRESLSPYAYRKGITRE